LLGLEDAGGQHGEAQEGADGSHGGELQQRKPTAQSQGGRGGDSWGRAPASPVHPVKRMRWRNVEECGRGAGEANGSMRPAWVCVLLRVNSHCTVLGGRAAGARRHRG
jgi:hypothetical protein